MMTCKEIQDQLSSYIDHELTAVEMTQVSQHLEGCADCRQARTSLLNIKRLVRAQPKVSIPADLVEAIEAEAGATTSFWRSDAFMRRAMPLLVGAATVFAAWFLTKAQEHVGRSAPAQMAAHPTPTPGKIIAYHSVDPSSTSQN